MAKRVDWRLWLAVVLLGFASSAVAAVLPVDDPMRKVEARVLDSTAAGESGSFVILLRDQCDLRAAPAMGDADARGWYVYRNLRRHARRTQLRLRRELWARGVRYRAFWAANALVVSGDRRLVEDLAAREDVQAIESNLPSQWIEDPEVSDYAEALQSAAVPEWGVSSVQAPAVWALGYTGAGIVVGNQDTGMQWDHPALRPHYRGWNGSVADHNFNWHDSIHSNGGVCGANSATPCDDDGHGTHTTGTAIGSDGATNLIGVAPGAKWIGCRNMDRGVGTPATYMECFQFFMAPTDLSGNNADPSKRPHVMNNSWGCPPSEGCAANTLKTVVENAEAAGIFVEVSAGNAGPNCSTVDDPPAIYAAGFSTGAYDINNTLASFSSRGPVTVDSSNRLKPDISGPGVNVRSSLRSSSYGNLSGTSMAGPHVVGVVALLWSARPQLLRDVATTKSILQATANPAVVLSQVQTCGGVASSTIPNNSFGYGRVDALAALAAVPSLTPTATASATPTPDPSFTATASSTATPSPTRTITVTPTVSATPSSTPTPSETATPSSTPTVTQTPTISATPTPTPSVVSAVAGRIRYYSADRPVANVNLSLAGAASLSTATDANGAYAFGSVPFGNWTLTPLHVADYDSGVTAFDAVLTLQGFVGTATLDAMQKLAADANGSGTLTAIDASSILRFRVGLISHLPVAVTCNSDWAFVPIASGQTQSGPLTTTMSCQPGAIMYSDLQADVANQDFLGVLYGDVNGNWNQGTGGVVASPRLRWAGLRARAGEMRQALYVESSSPVYGFDAELSYDPARWRPRAVRRIGARHALLVSNLAVPGIVRLAVASAEPLAIGERPLLAVILEPLDR